MLLIKPLLSLIHADHLSVRLVGGQSPREGVVQVFYNNTWGWVCDEGWDKQDADVVCRQLGYQVSSESKSTAVSEPSHEDTWMNNVQCVGNETSLSSCANDGWQSHGCGKGQKAGVVCSGPEGNKSC